MNSPLPIWSAVEGTSQAEEINCQRKGSGEFEELTIGHRWSAVRRAEGGWRNRREQIMQDSVTQVKNFGLYPNSPEKPLRV